MYNDIIYMVAKSRKNTSKKHRAVRKKILKTRKHKGGNLFNFGGEPEPEGEGDKKPVEKPADPVPPADPVSREEDARPEQTEGGPAETETEGEGTETTEGGPAETETEGEGGPAQTEEEEEGTETTGGIFGLFGKKGGKKKGRKGKKKTAKKKTKKTKRKTAKKKKGKK